MNKDRVFTKESLIDIFKCFSKCMKGNLSNDDLKNLIKNDSLYFDELKSYFSLVSNDTRFYSIFYDKLTDNNTFTHKMFVNTNIENYDLKNDGIVLSKNNKMLLLLFRESCEDPIIDDIYIRSLSAHRIALVVVTNFDTFRVLRYDKTSSNVSPILSMNRKEMVDDISLVGSLWHCLYPSHKSLLTRTIAISLPRTINSPLNNNEMLFSKDILTLGISERDEYIAKERICKCFNDVSGNGTTYELCGLNKAITSLSNKNIDRSAIVSRQEMGSFIVNTYRPPCSPVLEFEPYIDINPKRSDYVISHLEQSVNSSNEYQRDYAVLPNDLTEPYSVYYSTQIDILHTLAIRRSTLLRLGFSKRVYTIAMPPALIKEDTNTQLFLVPVIILYLVPEGNNFRRTFTISYVVIPTISTDEILRPQITDIDKLRLVQMELKKPFLVDADTIQENGKYVVDGPLAKLINIENDKPFSIQQILTSITRYTMNRIVDTSEVKEKEIDMLIYSASVESRLSTMLLLVNWLTEPGSAQPWEKWLTTGEDTAIRDNIYKLMFYEDYIDPYSSYSSRKGTDLSNMLVGNILRTDMNGMTFFDPTNERKLIIYPKHREIYPNYSIIRWMSFSLFAESALSALQGMIQQFYADLEKQGDLKYIIEVMQEMHSSFAELYDLDIRLYLYRSEYVRLRELLNVDRDYQYFNQKMVSVKEDASLREQRLINKLLIALTVSSISVAAIGVLAQVDRWTQWSISKYLFITFSSVLVLTSIAFGIYDGIRKLFKE